MSKRQFDDLVQEFMQRTQAVPHPGVIDFLLSSRRYERPHRPASYPFPPGTDVSWNEDGTADIWFSGARVRVSDEVMAEIMMSHNEEQRQAYLDAIKYGLDRAKAEHPNCKCTMTNAPAQESMEWHLHPHREMTGRGYGYDYASGNVFGGQSMGFDTEHMQAKIVPYMGTIFTVSFRVRVHEDAGWSDTHSAKIDVGQWYMKGENTQVAKEIVHKTLEGLLQGIAAELDHQMFLFYARRRDTLEAVGNGACDILKVKLTIDGKEIVDALKENGIGHVVSHAEQWQPAKIDPSGETAFLGLIVLVGAGMGNRVKNLLEALGVTCRIVLRGTPEIPDLLSVDADYYRRSLATMLAKGDNLEEITTSKLVEDLPDIDV